MMSWLGPAPEASLTIAGLVDRLAAKPTVAGIVVMGSTGDERFSHASDHDVCLVMVESAPIRMVATWVQDHLTEIYLTNLANIRDVVSKDALSADSDAAELANWIREGHVVFDRSGLLAQAQEGLRKTPPPKPGRYRAYDWWFSIGYNLAQTKRKLMSNEEHYRLAAETGIVSCLRDIAKAYFAVRSLTWPGDKEATKYWLAHDRDFIEVYLACLREPGIDRKVQLYEDIARLALAPIGDLWSKGTTMVGFGPAYGSEEWPNRRPSVEEALEFWRGLAG